MRKAYIDSAKVFGGIIAGTNAIFGVATSVKTSRDYKQPIGKVDLLVLTAWSLGKGAFYGATMPISAPCFAFDFVFAMFGAHTYFWRHCFPMVNSKSMRNDYIALNMLNDDYYLYEPWLLRGWK